LTAELDQVIKVVVDTALREDLGFDFDAGDITTEAIVGGQLGSASISTNQSGIVAGMPVAEAVFAALGTTVEWRPKVRDGESIAAGRVIAGLTGDLKTILKGERTALNILSRLSGIATLTHRYVDAVAGTQAAIYDTRKTTPGLRVLEKYAVIMGGGRNHRFGLYDAILIKDNHLIGRTVGEAIELAKRAQPGRLIEVEVETIDQLNEAIEAAADIVLLDNMDISTISESVAIAKGKVEIEVSGGINLDNIRAVAIAGAERISIGAITQGAPPIDFSLTVTGA